MDGGLESNVAAVLSTAAFSKTDTKND